MTYWLETITELTLLENALTVASIPSQLRFDTVADFSNSILPVALEPGVLLGIVPLAVATAVVLDTPSVNY